MSVEPPETVAAPPRSERHNRTLPVIPRAADSIHHGLSGVRSTILSSAPEARDADAREMTEPTATPAWCIEL